jgi:hypothetical protein
MPPMPRAALDELYHFLQYLQFKYNVDLELPLEVLEYEIDGFDADVSLQSYVDLWCMTIRRRNGVSCWIRKKTR